MASITIRRLDDAVKAELRIRAAKRGRSMEEEARAILKTALSVGSDSKLNFAQAIRRHVEPLGGVDLRLQGREPVRRPLKLT